MRVTDTPTENLVMPVSLEEQAQAEERTSAGSQDHAVEDVQLPRAARTPQAPNPAEQKVHALTHLPHRDWCDVCVKARGRDEAHLHAEETTRITDQVDGLEVIQMDYTFMEDLKVLSMYGLAHRGGAATAIEKKGVDPWVVTWIVKKLTMMGVKDCRMRTDPEGRWWLLRSRFSTVGLGR
jgi:hypothetical protein